MRSFKQQDPRFAPLTTVIIFLRFTALAFSLRPKHMCSSYFDHSSDALANLIRRPCTPYYTLVESFKTYDKAKGHCWTLGASLALPKEEDQRSFLKELSSSHKRLIFIGARADDGVEEFRWEDGTRVFDDTNFKFDGAIQPGDVCAAMTPSGSITLVPCELSLPFYCQRCFLTTRVTKTEITASSCEFFCICEGRAHCDGMCGNKCVQWKQPTGLSPSYCDMLPCPSFRFGPNCEQQCYCKGFKPCHLVTGKCPVIDSVETCETGWSGPACNKTACPIGRYGAGCESTCGCANHQSCSDNGVCHLGCLSRWSGAKCDKQELEIDGKPRPQICNPHCERPSPCDPTGKCYQGCKPGWLGLYCYNIDADNPPQIENTSTDLQNNKCSPYCGGDGLCDSSGNCDHGCVEGWVGKKCTKKVGVTCSFNCGGDGDCEVNGQCVHGCVEGWVGTNCDKQPDKYSIFISGVAASVVGSGLAILIVVVVVVVWDNKKRKKVQEHKSDRIRNRRHTPFPGSSVDLGSDWSNWSTEL